jgi:hypothetical protein
MSRRGRILPANASDLDTHRDSLTSRFTAGNTTFLAEARLAHAAGAGRSYFNGSFDNLMYERPFSSLGCVALAKLANLTAVDRKNGGVPPQHAGELRYAGGAEAAKLYAEALRAEASMLPWMTTYQATHGYRGMVPSFMALSAM